MARMRLLALAPLVAALSACSDASIPRIVAEATLTAGDHRLVLDESPRVRLLRGDVELVALDPDGLRLGLAGPVDDDTNYDPYRLLVPTGLYIPPVEPVFVTPASASLREEDEGRIGLALDFGAGRSATLYARAQGEGRFELSLVPGADVTDVAYLALRGRVASDEAFYGLGELTDDVNQRGKVRAMQLELEPTTEAGYNDAHAPVPLLVGTHGWGLFVETRLPTAFDVGATSPDRIEALVGVGTEAAEGLRFHLLGAEHPLDVPARYLEVAGPPRLPPRWAHGPLVWRDENDDQAQVEADLDTLRDRDLATTGIWIDRPYAAAVNTFDFETARFPAPQAMLDKARALGLETALWHTPYLDEKSPATAALRAEATAKGYYPKSHGIALNKWGKLLDLTNPEAVAWWQSKLASYVTMGIRGFKLDYAEDVVIGPTAKRIRWEFADGSDERTQHSAFQLHYHRTYREALPPEEAFLLARTARYGDQVNGAVIWPGDLDATFARRGEPMKDGDETYLATGGFPASIVAGLTLATVGFSFYGADTGGYRHAPPDAELFSRWFEQTALSTVMQVGTSTNDVPWEPTAANGFDAALLDRYREYARLHLRLFPYVWSHAERLALGGRPLGRALGLAYPELGVHPNDTYLLGDDLLVAPVVERGATARDVVFPPGRWLHWFTGELVDGESLGAKPRRVEAPLGRLPLFLRAGGLVPMLRPTIDTLSPTTEPERVDSYATDPGLLYVRGFARFAAHFGLFDGGELTVEVDASSTSLTFKSGAELVDGAVFELVDADPPASFSGGALSVERASPEDVAALGGYHYDAGARRLVLRVNPGSPLRIVWP